MLLHKSRFPNPKGTTRIYFCSHPDDFDQHFAFISDALLSACNCSVFYPSDQTEFSDDWSLLISQTQLIVVPVSRRFLDAQGSAMHTFCALAMQQYVPFVPIMLESGLEEEFARKWGASCSLHLYDPLVKNNILSELQRMLSPILVTPKENGSWIFLSHSSADIATIRKIRNQFEANGKNPLAFHLKCLQTDTEAGCRELEDLIKREIDARDWFVFCESEAANNSQYVQMEKDYVIQAGKKKIWTLDLSLSTDEQLKMVDRICSQVNIFLSYRKKDRRIAAAMQQALSEKDFDVWYDDFLIPGQAFSEEIADSIFHCDYFIALISEGYEESYCGMIELPRAIQRNKEIIPIIIGDASIPTLLRDHQCYRIPSLPKSDDIYIIAEYIEAQLRCNMGGPINQSDAFETVAQIRKRIFY